MSDFDSQARRLPDPDALGRLLTFDDGVAPTGQCEQRREVARAMFVMMAGDHACACEPLWKSIAALADIMFLCGQAEGRYEAMANVAAARQKGTDR